MLQIALQNLITHGYEILLAMLFAVLDSIEGIQQHTTTETYLCLGERLTIAGKQGVTRVVLQGIVAYIRLTEIVSQSLLHLLRRKEWLQCLWLQVIEAALPHQCYVLAKVLGLGLTDAPLDSLGLALLDLCKSKYGGSQGKLTDVALRCLNVRIAKSKLGLLLLAIKPQVTQRSFATQDNLACLMGSHTLLWGVKLTDNSHRLTVSLIINTGHRRRQTVLAEVPAL